MIRHARGDCTPDGGEFELRPGMQCLLAVLNGNGLGRQVEEAEWACVFRLAEKERVLPCLLAQLESSSYADNSSLKARLHAARRANQIEAFYWRGQLKGLLRAFHDEGVPVIPLKGPALAERIYGGVETRACQDLDLLVYRHDLARSQGLLGRLGFTPLEPDCYQQRWRRNAMAVELHCDVADRRVFDFHIEGAWREAYPTTFEGVPAWQFSPEDEFLFLCLHAVRHELNRLSVALDVARATHLLASSTARHFRPEIRTLRRHGVLGYLTAKRLFPGICLQIPMLEHDLRAVDALEPVAEDRVRNILTRPDSYLSWAGRQRLHVCLEISPWRRGRRRLDHLWRMVRHGLVAELEERDYTFAGRLGLTRPWQVRLLRPFRLMFVLRPARAVTGLKQPPR